AVVELRDDNAARRVMRYQTLGLQPTERLPNRSAAQPDLLGQLNFAQALPGLELTVLDGASDIAIRRFATRKVHVRIANGSRWVLEKSIMTFLVARYSFNACSPFSRPKPLSLKPPNGVCTASERYVFTHTWPACNARVTLMARGKLSVHTP